MSASATVSITSLPVSLVGLTQLEEVRVALERSLDGSNQDIEALEPRIQAWLQEYLQASSGEQLLSVLEEFAQSAPVIDIELATPPTEEWRESLVTWLRSQISPIVLVRIHTRRVIIAGFRLRTGKHQYDMSLAARLETPKNMQEIMYAS